MSNSAQKTDNDNFLDTKTDEVEVNLVYEIFKYLNYWMWFLVSAFIFVSGAYVYLRYTPDIFNTSSKIKILDNSTSSFKMPTDGISLFGRSKVNLENEVEIIKSYSLLYKVIDELDLTSSYYLKGYVNNSELWRDNPIKVEWLVSKDSINSKSIYFSITIKNNGFLLESQGKTAIKQFNTPILIDGIPCKIVLKNNNDIKKLVANKYSISFIPVDIAVYNLANSLVIDNVGKQSDILQLSVSGVNKQKSEDVLNEVIKQFNQDGINDRQLVSQRTIDFVNDRFVFLTTELDSIESNKESYKRANQLSYIEADAGDVISKKTTTDSELFKLETQVELAKLLDSSLKKGRNNAMLPLNIGVTNANINSLSAEYNSILLERDKLLISAGDKNPAVVAFTDKIEELKKNILVSIDVYQQELSLSLRKLNELKDSNMSLFGKIPTKEKILRAIDRQQLIKENLYVLLLQKREEASINLAITAPSLKIVNKAFTGQSPIAPKRNMIYFGALLIGLLLPFGFLYLKFLLDTKIHNKLDFDRLAPDVPIVAEIPFITEDHRIISNNDRSVLAESFRILRTNINFLMPLKKQGECPVIFTASSIKGEGKTFVSVNLALTLSSMDKKVLLIGGDLRNPQLHKYLNVNKNRVGLSNYLYDVSTDWKNLINENIFDNPFLNIIFAGSVPPNPAELLSNGRFEDLLTILKKEYDYIVVDTAPTILVTDTLLIANLSDLTVYVTRADHTDKKLLKYSRGLKLQGKMNNMAYVINNVGGEKGYGYGYGYSYGYGYGYNYGYGYGYGDEDDLVSKITRKAGWLSWLKNRK